MLAALRATEEHLDPSADDAAEDVSAEMPGARTDQEEDVSAETPTPPSARAADALVAMAETALEHGPAARAGGDRHQVVVHVDAETLAADAPGRSELDDGTSVSPETARRLACDASIVALGIGRAGPQDVGRKTRSIPPAMRRALAARDRGCRFPGCTQRRFVDGHHIDHWAQGGHTKLDNLVLLCRHHHRLVHEGGFSVSRSAGGRLRFHRPSGRALPDFHPPPHGAVGPLVAANRRHARDTHSATPTPDRNGDRLDVGLATELLFSRAARARADRGG